LQKVSVDILIIVIMKKCLHLAVVLLGTQAFAQTNNVGIGTASPNKKLHIKSSSTSTLKIEGDSSGYTNADIELVANNGANDRGLGLIMTDTGGATSWFMGRPYSGSDRFMINRKVSPMAYNEASALSNGSGASTFTENCLTITNTGNVGIGSTAPSHKLHLNGISPMAVEGLAAAPANEKVLTANTAGEVHQQSSPLLSSASALSEGTLLTQTVGYPGVTNATRYDTDAIVLQQGVYLATPYNYTSAITYTTSYYGQFTSMASAGTIDSGFINFELSVFTSSAGYYNRSPYIIKVYTPTATVFSRMWSPYAESAAGAGNHFSIPAGQGYFVQYTKIN
jgi:hypothetical protein